MRLFGAAETISVPLNTKFPPFVKLESVTLNPLSVTLDPALTVSVEIVTLDVKVGINVAVETMRAVSPAPGTPVSQLRLSDQSVLVVPHQVCGWPPKFQLTLLPELTEFVPARISTPAAALLSATSTMARARSIGSIRNTPLNTKFDTRERAS